MVLNGQVRITFIVAITLTIFLMAIISVSNSSMYAAARGGEFPLQAHSSDGGKTWSYGSYKPNTLTKNDNLLIYVGNHGVYESEPDIFVMRPGMGPVSSDANPTDNSLNYVSNLPRFDREAAYFRIAAPDIKSDRSWNVLRFNQGLGGLLYSPSSLLPPNIQGYQQVSASCEDTYRVCVIDAHPEYYIPSSMSCSAGGFGAGCPGASGVTSGGTLTSFKSFEPSENIVTRHGGIVQVSSTPQYTLIYDYNNQDHPLGLLPVSILGGGSRGPPSMYAVKVLPGSEIYSIGDPGNMDPDNFMGTSFGDSELQNEEAQFQDNLKNAIIHHAL